VEKPWNVKRGRTLAWKMVAWKRVAWKKDEISNSYSGGIVETYNRWVLVNNSMFFDQL